MSLVPQAFSFPNLFFTYFKPSTYLCPRVWFILPGNIIQSWIFLGNANMAWERAYFNDVFRVENKGQRNQWNFKTLLSKPAKPIGTSKTWLFSKFKTESNNPLNYGSLLVSHFYTHKLVLTRWSYKWKTQNNHLFPHPHSRSYMHLHWTQALLVLPDQMNISSPVCYASRLTKHKYLLNHMVFVLVLHLVNHRTQWWWFI